MHLTRREHQVLYFIMTRGSSNKVIARLLDITESTVKQHVSHLLKKYCAKTRSQLIIFAEADKAKVLSFNEEKQS